jgi:hypothetical protein
MEWFEERRLLEEKDRLFQENKVLLKAMEMMAMVTDCGKCDAVCGGATIKSCINIFKAKARRALK